jgi:hypothetical protein
MIGLQFEGNTDPAEGRSPRTHLESLNGHSERLP